MLFFFPPWLVEKRGQVPLFAHLGRRLSTATVPHCWFLEKAKEEENDDDEEVEEVEDVEDVEESEEAEEEGNEQQQQKRAAFHFPYFHDFP